MPIYEYECTECGLVDEVVQKMTDKPLTKCRHCSGTVKKIISQSMFHLRGGGWYADSYGNKPGTGSAMPKKAPAQKTPECTEKKVEKITSGTEA